MSIGIGLGTGITNFPSASGPEPTYDELIAKMMSGVDKGVWFDATDTSTMFQDISGLTPVTTVEQSIGLWLDKSKGLTFGGQFVINSDFSQGDTNWTLGTGWAIADGKATKTPGVVGTLTSTHAIVSTTWYQALARRCRLMGLTCRIFMAAQVSILRQMPRLTVQSHYLKREFQTVIM